MLNQVIKSNDFRNARRAWIEEDNTLGYVVCVLVGEKLHFFECSALDLDALGALIVGVLDEDRKSYRMTEYALQNTRWNEVKQAASESAKMPELGKMPDPQEGEKHTLYVNPDMLGGE